MAAPSEPSDGPDWDAIAAVLAREAERPEIVAVLTEPEPERAA